PAAAATSRLQPLSVMASSCSFVQLFAIVFAIPPILHQRCSASAKGRLHTRQARHGKAFCCLLFTAPCWSVLPGLFLLPDQLPYFVIVQVGQPAVAVVPHRCVELAYGTVDAVVACRHLLLFIRPYSHVPVEDAPADGAEQIPHMSAQFPELLLRGRG